MRTEVWKYRQAFSASSTSSSVEKSKERDSWKGGRVGMVNAKQRSGRAVQAAVFSWAVSWWMTCAFVNETLLSWKNMCCCPQHFLTTFSLWADVFQSGWWNCCQIQNYAIKSSLSFKIQILPPLFTKVLGNYDKEFCLEFVETELQILCPLCIFWLKWNSFTLIIF